MAKSVVQRMPGFISKHGYALSLMCVSVVSLLIRIKFMFQERLWPDEALYAWNAMRIAKHPLLLFSAEINEFHPPFFVSALAVGSLFNPTLFACRMVSLVMGLLCTWVIYILGRRVSNPFGGLVSAILLSFNSVFLKFSTKVLSDSLFILLMMLLALVLLELPRSDERKLDLYAGGLGAVLVLTKWSGLAVLILIIVFYVFALKHLSVTARLRKMTAPVLIILGTVVLLLVNNRFQLGGYLPDMSALREATQAPASRYFYVLGINSLLDSPLVTVVMLVGMVALFKLNDKPISILLFSWLVIYIVVLSCAAEKLFRYSLAYLPVLILCVAIGFNALVNFFFADKKKTAVYWLLIGLLCFMAGIQYPEIDYTLSEEQKFYTGFPEAGDWVRSHIDQETTVIASSPRAIRYYSGVNFVRFGGQLTDFPKTGEQERDIIKNTKGHVILVLDNWGREEALLVHPDGSAFQNFLQRNGYSMVKSIGKLRYRLSKGESAIAPVIYIYEKRGRDSSAPGK